MAVYIDPLYKWGRKGRFRWAHSSHMYADSLAELHEMADKIGLRREWFQDDERLPHYDLRPKHRETAVTLGVIEHTRTQMQEFLRTKREERKIARPLPHSRSDADASE